MPFGKQILMNSAHFGRSLVKIDGNVRILQQKEMRQSDKPGFVGRAV